MHESSKPAPPDPPAELRAAAPRPVPRMGSMARGDRGMLYARRRMSSPPVVFRGYTAKSLAEQIREHETRQR